MKQKVTVGIFGIITNEQDEVLLYHRNKYDMWNIPGSGLGKGKNPWDNVIHETKE